MNTGQRIKMLREERNITQSELAKILEIKTRATISKWENGDNSPQLKDIIKLAQLFEVSSDYLLGIVQDRNVKEIEENKKLREEIDDLFAGKESNISASAYARSEMTPDELELVKEITYKSMLEIRKTRDRE